MTPDPMRFSTEYDPDQHSDLSDAPRRHREPRPWAGNPEFAPDGPEDQP